MDCTLRQIHLLKAADDIKFESPDALGGLDGIREYRPIYDVCIHLQFQDVEASNAFPLNGRLVSGFHRVKGQTCL